MKKLPWWEWMMLLALAGLALFGLVMLVSLLTGCDAQGIGGAT